MRGKNYIMLMLFAYSMFVSCNYKNQPISVYQVLKRSPIRSISFVSFQVNKTKGAALLKWDTADDILYFLNWFKPPQNLNRKLILKGNFVPDGYVLVSFKGTEPAIKIEFQMKSGYRILERNKYIYEQFSYQFNLALIELLTKESSDLQKPMSSLQGYKR